MVISFLLIQLLKKEAIISNLNQRILDIENIKKDIDNAKQKMITTHSSSLKLNCNMINDICNCILGGLNIEEACKNLGISKVSYYFWFKNAERDINNNEHIFL